MSAHSLVNVAGRRRSPATVPGYHAGRPPRNKGSCRHRHASTLSIKGDAVPADPPRPDDIIVVIRKAGHDRHGLRIRALVAILWRGGLRNL
jgi:hypothetical protein